MGLTKCVWRGESWLKQSVALERHYPEHEILFRNLLQIPNAKISHIIREAETIRPGNTKAHIEKVFLALFTHWKVQQCTPVEKEQIRALKMFPIISTPGNGPYQFLESITGMQPWLIADREIFRIQFKNILPILGFSVDTILRTRSFLEALGVGERFLSDVATSITEAHGDVELHRELTKRYQERSDFFFR